MKKERRKHHLLSLPPHHNNNKQGIGGGGAEKEQHYSATCLLWHRTQAYKPHTQQSGPLNKPNACILGPMRAVKHLDPMG